MSFIQSSLSALLQSPYQRKTNQTEDHIPLQLPDDITSLLPHTARHPTPAAHHLPRAKESSLLTPIKLPPAPLSYLHT